MKIVAVLFAFFIAYANVGNNPVEAGVFSGLGELIGGVLNYIGNALSVVGNSLAKGTFMADLKADIQAKLISGGVITENLMGSVITHTLKLATGNKIISADDANRILATFHIVNDAKPLEIVDVDGLAIQGGFEAGADFKMAIKSLIHTQFVRGPELGILAALEGYIIDLLTANAIIKVKGAFDLRSYFNIDELAAKVKAEAGNLLDSVVQTLNNLQGQIAGNVQAAQSYINNLKGQLEAKVQEAGLVSLQLLSKVVSSTLSLATSNSLVSEDAALRLVATYAPELGSNTVPLTAADIEALTIGGSPKAAAEFKSTLVGLHELKSKGISSFALLSGLQSAVLDFLTANAIFKVQGALEIKNSFLLTPIVDVLQLASDLISKLQSNVAGDVSAATNFLSEVQNYIADKVDAGGKLTVDLVGKVTGATLRLATGNDLIDLDTAARIAASFGINIGVDAKPLDASEVDSLKIGGNPGAAAQFKATLKALLELVAQAGGPGVSTLAGLNAAVLDQLAANGVVSVSTALGLKGYFMI